MFEDELDDLYFLEAMEAVEGLYDKDALNTCNLQTHEVVDNAVRSTSAISTNSLQKDLGLTEPKSKTDYRSRLLQTLSNKEKKPEYKIGNDTDQFANDINLYNSSEKSCTDINSVELNLRDKTSSSGLVSNKVVDDETLPLPKINTIKKVSAISIFKSPKNDNLYPNNNGRNFLDPGIRKRKFPGPAGLLPNWKYEVERPCSNLADDSILENKQEKPPFYPENTLCSQNSSVKFGDAWKNMMLDFLDKLQLNPVESVNIRWLLRKVTFGGDILVLKIPLLVVMIHSIDLSHLDAAAVFRDETGEMNGIISNTVIDKYSKLISQGTVLVLKDITILSPAGFRICISLKEQQRKHYINVTLNSLVCLYSLDDLGEVTKTEIIELKKEELMFLLAKSNSAIGQKALIEESELDNGNENLEYSLFSNLNTSYTTANTDSTIPSVSPNLPFRNSGQQANNIIPLGPQLTNKLKFSHPSMSNCIATSPNNLGKPNYNSLLASNKTMEQISLPQLNSKNNNTKMGMPVLNNQTACSRTLVSNCSSAKSDGVLITNMVYNSKTRMHNPDLAMKIGPAVLKANSIPSTVTKGPLSLAVLNSINSEVKKSFKFVNRTAIDSQTMSRIDSFTGPVLNDLRLKCDLDYKASEVHKNRCVPNNDISVPSLFSTKKFKTDIFDEDDDDEDIDSLLSSVDTDSIMMK